MQVVGMMWNFTIGNLVNQDMVFLVLSVPYCMLIHGKTIKVGMIKFAIPRMLSFVNLSN